MSAACASARTAVYRRRRPERTVLYRTVQTHLATWLELSRDSGQTPPVQPMSNASSAAVRVARQWEFSRDQPDDCMDRSKADGPAS